ncbi:response regulator [Desulfamplus magnetovallimortis]|nr:response regulator [Desulfamplus magnetovallimortis]
MDKITTGKFSHTVLIVDDEKKIGKSIGRLLTLNDISFVYAESGHKAMDEMRSAEKPFSVILSDQQMPEMSGAEFLEQAKKIHPDTIRFLLTAYSDIDTVTASINKGSVHRYLLKPWDDDILMETLNSAFLQYEKIIENERLLVTAKTQHKKLLQMEQALMEITSRQYREIRKRDREIEHIQAQLKDDLSNASCHPDQLIDELNSFIDNSINKEMVNKEKVVKEKKTEDEKKKK